MASDLKIGVHRGSGPHPGYRWSILLVPGTFGEARRNFNESQYWHLAEQMQELAREASPSQCPTVAVEPIETYYELKDKGGILAGINARVYFYIDPRESIRALVVLGSDKKQNDGAVLIGVKNRMNLRLRRYLNGEYGQAEINEARGIDRKPGER